MGRPEYASPYDRGVPPVGLNGVGTPTGRRKSASLLYIPTSKWTWAFSGVALGQCIIALAIEAYVFGKFQASLMGAADQANPKNALGQPITGALTIPTYLALFIFGFIYELVLVWDALRLKNTIQVIGICLYNMGMLIYAGVEMAQVDEAIQQLRGNDYIRTDTWSNLRPFLIAAPCVIALGTVLLSIIAWKLYDEFAWTIYKHISADLRLKRRYLTYQIYIALLKFDFFFFLGFTVQFLVVVQDQQHDAEFYITIVAMPITIVLLFLAAYFVRRESSAGHILIMTIYFAAMVYFVFKLVRMYDSVRSKDYEPVRRSLTTFAVLTILLLVVTITVAGLCMKNFNKGLRPHIHRTSVPGPEEAKYGEFGNGYVGSAHQLGNVPTRMTID
ncbi:hypothetical protein EJ03DRAFT_185077 [Teratosphaeria nubilosa]|uniref:Uncharacterized protein n=1 Tax=Teratosphaeria nubilosa TaxID=161662 RepID=A0A6G1L1U3_9PEZI|nr:hypothetical protein EJ03DRAFT_185077 [Teratosphaeria nubilosa]